MSDILPPASKVFLYAFLAYASLHALWWSLEIESKQADIKSMYIYIYIYLNFFFFIFLKNIL